MSWLDSRQAERLRDQLRDIPELYVTLGHVAGTRRGDTAGRRGVPSSRPVSDMAVSHLADRRRKDFLDWATEDPRSDPETDTPALQTLDRYGVIPALGLWLRIIDDEVTDDDEMTPLALDPDDWRDIRRICARMAEVTPWMLGQQWVTELAADIGRIHRELCDAHGIRREYRPSCRTCGNPADGRDGGTWYECTWCGRNYVLGQDLRALGQAQYVPGEDAAQLLDIKWSTLRKWRERGLLRPVDRTAWGRDLYDLDQVKAVRDRQKADDTTTAC